jgi:ferredoxin-NADP reductase
MAPVLSVNDETPTIRTFRIARPDGFDFTAGQFLPVRVRAEGREHVRCYSISSSPGSTGYLEISVRRIGLVSGALHATLRPGSMLAIKHPAGAFTYPAGEDRPLVFIAGGVGITPLMSMARHAVATEPMRPATLLYSIRTEEDFAFRDEIRFLDRRHPQFRAFVAVSEGQAGPGFFPGMLNESLFQTTVPDIAHTTCMVCGPPPMRDAMTGMLLGLGVPRPQIHYEIFEAAKAAAGSQPEAAEAAPASSRRGATHEARFTQSGTSERVSETQTLLEAAESCGAAIPSLCRAGVCGTCRTRVTEGDIDCASQMLDEQDRREGFVLPCVSRLKSDCVVEA